MIKKKYIELINRGIDGDLSGRESTRLQNLLAKNPEARKLHRDLDALSNVLHSVDDVEPSSHLKKHILNALPLNAHAPREKRSLLRSLRSTFEPRLSVKYAYVFSVGLIVGVIGYALIDRASLFDISDLYGTMGVPKSYENIGDIAVDLNGVHGTFNIKHSKDILLAEVNLSSQQEIEIAFEYNGKEISFDGFRQLRGMQNSVNISQNAVMLASIGENRCIILFHNGGASAAPMTFKIFSSGALLYERTISPSHKSR